MAIAVQGGWMSEDGNIWDTQIEANYADCDDPLEREDEERRAYPDWPPVRGQDY